MTLKDELPRSVVAQYTAGKKKKNKQTKKQNREIAQEGMTRLSQKGNNTELWMCLVVKVKSDVVKNNIA